MNLCDGIVRLTERNSLQGVVAVPLVAVAHQFQPGHRVRLLVAGGAFPRFSLNPGTGRLIDTPDRYRPTRYAVALNGRSLVRLPVVEGSP